MSNMTYRELKKMLSHFSEEELGQHVTVCWDSDNGEFIACNDLLRNEKDATLDEGHFYLQIDKNEEEDLYIDTYERAIEELIKRDLANTQFEDKDGNLHAKLNDGEIEKVLQTIKKNGDLCVNYSPLWERYFIELNAYVNRVLFDPNFEIA